MSHLINGLGGLAGFGEGVLTGNDDGSITTEINLDSIFANGINFFGAVYHGIFLNNNGNLTFGNYTSQYTPQPIGANLGFPIIAALWTDIDTNPGSTGTPGYYLFHVIGGQVFGGGAVPEPMTWMVIVVGVMIAGEALRRRRKLASA